MKRCVIFGAAQIEDLRIVNILDDDYIICADGGYNHANKLGIEPQFVIGDLDSCSVPINAPIIAYPSEKDDTDTMLAIKKGVEAGCESFVFYGMIGGRLDHTFANIQALTYLAKLNKRAVIYSTDYVIYVVTHSQEINPIGRGQSMFSLFSLSEECRGVCIDGGKYPLKNAVISNSFPIGISNEFIGESALISIESGIALLMNFRLPAV